MLKPTDAFFVLVKIAIVPIAAGVEKKVQTQKYEQHAQLIVVWGERQRKKEDGHQKKGKWDAQVEQRGACEHGEEGLGSHNLCKRESGSATANLELFP